MSVENRKKREKQRRREDILSAAERVFSCKGYDATTMDAIAAEAEFSKGTVYQTFQSKYELFTALANQVVASIADGFADILTGPSNGCTLVQNMLIHYLQSAQRNSTQFRLALSWLASREPPNLESPSAMAHHKHIQNILKHLATAISMGQVDGSICQKKDSYVLACQLWSGMIGALLFCTRVSDFEQHFRIPQIDGYMSSFVDLLIAGLGPPQPPSIP